MTSEKDRLLSFVKDEEVLQLAKDLISIPSLSGDETQAAKFVAKFLEDNGIETELTEVDPGRFQPLGIIKGTGNGYSLMLNGHIDVDKLPLGIEDPWTPRVEGDRLYGHGIANMKAGVASMLMAAVAAKRAGIELKGDLIIAPVVGELGEGSSGSYYLVEKGIVPDTTIVTEPSILCIRTHMSGMVNIKITTNGVSIHQSAKHYAKNVSAIDKTIKVIETLRPLILTPVEKTRFGIGFTDPTPDPELPGLPRLNIGWIQGGLGEEYKQAVNFVPDICSIGVDVRYGVGMTPESIGEDLKAILESMMAEDPDFVYELEVGERLPPSIHRPADGLPPCATSEDEFIVKTLASNHEYVTGSPPRKVGRIPPESIGIVTGGAYASNDSGHLFKAGSKAISYGPGPTTEDVWLGQWCPISQIVDCAKVLTLTIADVCMKEK